MAEESKFSKNQQLGLFLASLGDVLSGDKNVVGNAMNRKQFLEQKISDQERKDRYQNFIKDLDEKSKGDNPQYSRSFYELAQALGPKGLDSLLLKKFESDERQQLQQDKIAGESRLLQERENLQIQREMRQLKDAKDLAEFKASLTPAKKQKIEDIIKEKVALGLQLSKGEQQIYTDVILRPTFQERLMMDFTGAGQGGYDTFPPNTDNNVIDLGTID